MSPLERTRSRERGSSTPFSLVLGLGLIVLPVMVLVLVLPTWEQRAVDANDAARDAARALVVADDWADGVASADQVVAQAVRNDGLPVSDMSVRCSGSLVPGGQVVAVVTVVVPVGEIPGLGLVGALHYRVSSTEHVDSYRASTA
ncbi:MAG: hypothetical protein ACRDZX_01310 [Acidimicrobiales bacterium]